MLTYLRLIIRCWKNYGFVALSRLILVKVFLPNQALPIRLLTHRLGIRKKTAIPGGKLSSIRFPELAPLRVFTIPASSLKRITLVTDSISDNSLYGGVGTALIFASLLAESKQAMLRIVTRSERPQVSNFNHILETYDIKISSEIEFVFAPYYDDKYELSISDNELFLTTSWWTTAATLASVKHDSVIYLLQEDERMFYPFGDERLRCEEILANQDIRFVVNTRLLLDHLIASGLNNMVSHGIWFEPAFPKSIYFPRKSINKQKKQLMFYARPNNLRNLFYFGIEVIEEAVIRNIIKLDEWDILLVGKDIPNIIFGNRYTPKKCEGFSWSEYAEFSGTIDLALSLMYTPHPSYPPFDLAASGAVVVTNRFGNKRDLGSYSKNILCGDLDLEAMISTLSEGIKLAENVVQRNENYESSEIESDWKRTLGPVIEMIARTS